MIRRGKRDDALPMLRETADELFDSGQFVNCPVATGFLMEALLDRGDEVSYRDFAARYRKMATDFGFEGHMALARDM
jgi:adenylate cyclase